MTSLFMGNGDGTFIINKAQWLKTKNGAEENRTFTLIVHNLTTKWIIIEIDRSRGADVASTGRIDCGLSKAFTEPLKIYVGTNRITRWSHGFIDSIDRSGGEMTFPVLDTDGSAYIEVTVKRLFGAA